MPRPLQACSYPGPLPQVVRPLRTFLHTVQRNQMLMTPTSAPRNSVMKSFIKRNTPLRVDPKVREPVALAKLCFSWLVQPEAPAPSAAGRSMGLDQGSHDLALAKGQLHPLWPLEDCPCSLVSAPRLRGLAGCP